MKFKTGDFVKIVKAIKYKSDNDGSFEAAKKNIGKTGKIISISKGDIFPYNIEGIDCIYSAKELELVEDDIDVFKQIGQLIGGDFEKSKQALHFNEGKLPVELVPVEAIEAIAHRLQLGIKKGYPANNWKKGLNYTELLGSIFRHLYAFGKGEKIDIDDKTGIEQPHLWGAICCLAFLVYYETYPEKYGKFDDFGEII